MVGERITDARRSRGLSIDDVAAITRLRTLTIEAIERTIFPCGGDSYAIGHLRHDR